MLRATEGPQAELGRWMHALIQVRPGECLHTINLYGWVDDDFATRQVILEVAGRAAELPGSLLLVGGDWNLEPDEFPIDVAQGSGLRRPLARPGATAPQGHRRLDWFLASSGLLPSTGWEELTAYKPDHTAVAIELDVQFTAPQFQGIKRSPEANVDQAHLRFWIEPAAWQLALAQQDVEELWELWNTAAVAALEVRPQGRGVLCLENKTLKPPKEDKESVQDALNQHLEASLLRTARTGQAVLAHAWPTRLG
eukprot:6471453-Amphidinium_carterae.1